MSTKSRTAIMPPDYWEAAKAHLASADPVLGSIIAHYQGETLASRGSAFFSLARAIVGQQISVKAADSVWAKLEAGLGGEILPDRVLASADEALRTFGLSGQKVKYLKEVALFFSRGAPDWTGRQDAEVIADLIAIKGIGTWSAEMFLIFHLLRPDVFPIADLGLRKAIERHYGSGQAMKLADMVALSERWMPYRTVATWYLWRSLDPVAVAY